MENKSEKTIEELLNIIPETIWINDKTYQLAIFPNKGGLTMAHYADVENPQKTILHSESIKGVADVLSKLYETIQNL